MCDECGGTGMFDVLSSIPCSCVSKKVDIAILIKKIIVFRNKAIKQKRWDDASDLKDIEKKLIKKLK